jgi:hypothetical protein
LDKSTIELLGFGTCTHLLGRALASLHNLSELNTQQPNLEENVRDTKLKSLQARWTIAVKIQLTIAFSKAQPLKALTTRNRPGNSEVSADPSIIRVLGTYMKEFESLLTLRLNLAFNYDEGGHIYSAYNAELMDTESKAASLRILEHLSRATAGLDDLHIGFGYTKTCDGFFKAMNQSLHLPALHRLCLSRLKTRKAHLKACLRSLQSTLKILGLEYIWLYGMADDTGIADSLLDELDLEEVTLRYLNFDCHGFRLSQVHKLRPKLRLYDVPSKLDNDGWAYVGKGHGLPSEITLKSADGDDVKHWLDVIDRERGGRLWVWEGFK